MTEQAAPLSSTTPGHGTMAGALPGHGQPPQNLADVLERVLEKGIVIVGDIQVNLLNIELLTIKVRLLVASVDKAREMGISWWEQDSFATPELEESQDGQASLEERLDRIEGRLEELKVRDDDG